MYFNHHLLAWGYPIARLTPFVTSRGGLFVCQKTAVILGGGLQKTMGDESKWRA
jgi:hypothetical protein